MAITSDSDLKVAIAGPPLTRVLMNKATIANQLAGAYTSHWRCTGLPAQAAIPGAAATCDDTLTGAWPIPTVTGGMTAYLGKMTFLLSVVSLLLVFDRLAHMGGLSGTVATAQTANVSAVTAQGQGRCKADYSDVQWFLEWYTDTGSTAVTATVAVTYHDDSTGTIPISLAATMRAGRLLPILPTNGKFIKSVQTVTLSATTGTAGSLGVTCGTLLTANQSAEAANKGITYDWAGCELAIVKDTSCLWFVTIPSTGTAAPVIVGHLLLIQK